jgi:hypothetical protein
LQFCTLRFPLGTCIADTNVLLQSQYTLQACVVRFEVLTSVAIPVTPDYGSLWPLFSSFHLFDYSQYQEMFQMDFVPGTPLTNRDKYTV